MLREIKYINKIISSNFTRLSFPHKLSYILTYRCNLLCKMCNIWKKNPVEELNLNQIEEFFTKSNRFSWVGLTGGEPFLREDITEVAKIILDNCQELVAMHFATNGTMTGRILEFVEKILKYKSKKVKLLFTLSIDGPAELHDKIRGVNGAWLQCVSTFKKLKDIKSVQPRIGITLSHYNFDKFYETFTSLKEIYSPLRFDDIGINIFHRSVFYYDNNNMPELDHKSIIRAIDQILAMDKDRFTANNFLRRKYLMLYKRYAVNKRPPLKCQALSSTCVMEPQGDVYPCGIYANKVANIREECSDLGEIWSRRSVKDVSMKCLKGMCPACWTPCDAYNAILGSLWKIGLWG